MSVDAKKAARQTATRFVCHPSAAGLGFTRHPHDSPQMRLFLQVLTILQRFIVDWCTGHPGSFGRRKSTLVRNAAVTGQLGNCRTWRSYAEAAFSYSRGQADRDSFF